MKRIELVGQDISVDQLIKCLRAGATGMSVLEINELLSVAADVIEAQIEEYDKMYNGQDRETFR